MKGRLAILMALVPAGTLVAHHGLTNFDTTTAVRIKGTVVTFHRINPHSFIMVEESGTGTERRRWAIEGPSAFQLDRRGVAKDVLETGDAVEVCGYLPKERTIWQMATPDPLVPSLAGRVLNAEWIVMPDGRGQSWGDYGVHKCFPAGHRDQHSR